MSGLKAGNGLHGLHGLNGLNRTNTVNGASGLPADRPPSAAVYAAADGLLARRAHSFHWARQLLGAEHAQRATRLYAFCRYVDDLADEATDVAAAHAALAAVRQALLTGASDDPQTHDMLLLMQTCGIDPAIPLELLSGVQSDLGLVRVADMDALLHYCYQVAGTVGLMMTAVLDVQDARALPHAIDLGVAMQLTNICRDVRDDAALGRRYLPATLVGPIEASTLVAPAPALRTRVTDAMAVLLSTADRCYDSGEQGLHHLPAGARAGIRVAARVYRGIGSTLRQRGLDCWSSRAQVSTAGKLMITLQALAVTPFAPFNPFIPRTPLKSQKRGTLQPSGPPAAGRAVERGLGD